MQNFAILVITTTGQRKCSLRKVVCAKMNLNYNTHGLGRIKILNIVTKVEEVLLLRVKFRADLVCSGL